MAIPWGLIIVIIGVLYGALKPGKQAKGRLFVNGLMIGFVLALIFLALAWAGGSPVWGVRSNANVILAFVIDAAFISLLFVLGVWLGDLLSGARGRGR